MFRVTGGLINERGVAGKVMQSSYWARGSIGSRLSYGTEETSIANSIPGGKKGTCHVTHTTAKKNAY